MSPGGARPAAELASPPRPSTDDPAELADEIENFIAIVGQVGFPAIQDWGGSAVRGNWNLCDRDDENAILWRFSKPWGEAINLLIHQRRIEAVPVHPLAVVKDGGALDLPLAKAPQPFGHQTPHWAPAELRIRGAAR